MTDGGERVAQFTILCSRITDVVGRELRKIQRLGNCNGSAVASLFFAMKMPLQFDVHIAAAKQSNQAVDLLSRLIHAATLQSRGERPIRTTGQADEAFGMLLQFFVANRTLAFLAAQFHPGNQAAKILIASAGSD
jgi:hypothetical protein